MDIKDRIISIMRSSFSNNEIDENSNSDNTDNWESINFLLLIVNLENDFKVKFKPEEIAELNSFKSINDSILKKLNKTFTLND